jgi:branched-chain amino acid transport system substrate-binding protein
MFIFGRLIMTLRVSGGPLLFFAAVLCMVGVLLPQRSHAEFSGNAIKVGIILTLSGPPARAGTREKDGIEMVAAKLNAAGGINGRPIQLVIQDDAADPNAAVNAFNSLSNQDDVVVIIGSTIGSSTMAFAPLAKRAAMPILAPNSTYDITHLGNDFLFRVGIPANIEVEAAADFLKKGGYKRIGLLYSNDSYGKQGADLLRAIKDLNFVSSEQVSTTATDYTPQITKIRSASPDVLVIWGGSPYPGIGIKSASQLGLEIPVVSPSAASSQATIQAAAGARLLSKWYVEGVFDQAKPENRQREGIEAFRSKFNADPDYFVATGWDAMTILGKALQLAGDDITRANVKIGLEKVNNYEGFGGIYSYSKTERDGTDARSLIWQSVVDGRFVRVD